MLIDMWRKLFHGTPVDQASSDTSGNEQPFKPAYIPMHGPGAKPLEKPDTAWHPGPKQKVAIAVVLALVLGSGVFFISSSNGGKSSASPESISFGGPGDNDESAVLGADSYSVPNSSDGSGSGTLVLPGNQTGGGGSSNAGGLIVKQSGSASASRTPATTSPRSTAVIAAPTPAPSPGSAPTPPAVTPAPSPAPAPSPSPQPQPITHSVDYNGSGFKPEALTIKKGDSVSFVHKGNQEAFQPGCQGGGLPNCLAPDVVSAGQSWSFTFDTVGTYVIENTKNTAETITITVTE